MFGGCTSLERVHELPAERLNEECYSYMFQGCKSLRIITMLATDISANGCLWDWLKNTASEGVLYKSKNAQWNHDSFIPEDWEAYNI
jgi:hypothetical protein